MRGGRSRFVAAAKLFAPKWHEWQERSSHRVPAEGLAEHADALEGPHAPQLFNDRRRHRLCRRMLDETDSEDGDRLDCSLTPGFEHSLQRSSG